MIGVGRHPLSLLPLYWFEISSWSLCLLFSDRPVVSLLSLWLYCWAQCRVRGPLGSQVSTHPFGCVIWLVVWLFDLSALFECWWWHALHCLLILTSFVVRSRFIHWHIYHSWWNTVLLGFYPPRSIDLLVFEITRLLGRAPFLLKILEASRIRFVFTWLVGTSTPFLAWSFATLRSSSESTRPQVTLTSWEAYAHDSGLSRWEAMIYWDPLWSRHVPESLLLAALGVDCGCSYWDWEPDFRFLSLDSWHFSKGLIASSAFICNAYHQYTCLLIIDCTLRFMGFGWVMIVVCTFWAYGVRLGYCLTIICTMLLFSC